MLSRLVWPSSNCTALKFLSAGRLRQLSASNGEGRGANHYELLRKARDGEVVVIVRPASAYEQAHLPFARSMPLAELRTRLADLPKYKPVVAYWRGPYCLMSADANLLLQEHGYTALQLRDGVAEWAAMANAGWLEHNSVGSRYRVEVDETFVGGHTNARKSLLSAYGRHKAHDLGRLFPKFMAQRFALNSVA